MRKLLFLVPFLVAFTCNATPPSPYIQEIACEQMTVVWEGEGLPPGQAVLSIDLGIGVAQYILPYRYSLDGVYHYQAPYNPTDSMGYLYNGTKYILSGYVQSGLDQYPITGVNTFTLFCQPTVVLPMMTHDSSS